MKVTLPGRVGLLLLAAAVLAAGLAVLADRWATAPTGLIYEINSGQVMLVRQDSPAADAGLQQGERLVAVGLLPLGSDPANVDDLLPVSVQQGTQLGVRWLALGRESEPSWALLLPLLAAFALWLAGLITGLFAYGRAAARLFALFALLAALALCCAGAADPPLLWATWLLAPASFAALIAYLWLQRTLIGSSEPRPARAWWALTAQALIVPAALLLGPRLLGPASGRALVLVAGLDLAVLPVAAHLLATLPQRFAAAPARRRLRLAALAGATAWLPAVLVGWAPLQAGLLALPYRPPLAPYGGALGLLGPALMYPAIAGGGDLFALEVTARRVAVALAAGGALLALAAGVLLGLVAALQPTTGMRTAMAAAVALLLLPAYEPVRRTLQETVDRRLDAGQPDYGRALQEIADALLLAPDERVIAGVLTGRAPALLGVTAIQAWLRDAGGRWVLFHPGFRDAQLLEPPRELLAGLDAQVAILDPPPVLAAGPPASSLPQLAGPTATTPATMEQPPLEAAMASATLCLAIHVGVELRGLLLLGPRRSQDPYRRAEREALVLLSRQVAAALQLADLLADLRLRNAELAQLSSSLARAREEERKHLSRELHDAVAQDLVALTRQLRRHQQGLLPDAIREDMLAQAQEALTATRRICNDLRPAILDLGLASALRELAERAPQPLLVHFEVYGAEQRLDEDREFALYRAAQEALTNAIKHAEASEAILALQFGPQMVEVQVRDNGRGFTPLPRLEKAGGDHLGLLGMRERIGGLGGTVLLESRPGQGTLVKVQIPI